jgi:hypothetical protein
MWCAAAFPPDTFWRQTERSFANAVAGAAEREVTLAWQIEFFARQKRLNRLSEYLQPIHSAQNDGAQALLGALFKMKRKGVPMKIERIERH